MAKNRRHDFARAKQKMTQQHKQTAKLPGRTKGGGPAPWSSLSTKGTQLRNIRWRWLNKHDRKDPIKAIKKRIAEIVNAVTSNEENESIPSPSLIYLGFENWPNKRRGAASRDRLLTDCTELGKWMRDGELFWRLQDGYYVPRPGDKRSDCAYSMVVELRPLGIEDLTDLDRWNPNPMMEWNNTDLSQFGSTTGRLSSAHPNMYLGWLKLAESASQRDLRVLRLLVSLHPTRTTRATRSKR